MSGTWIKPTGNAGALALLGLVFLYAGASQGNNAAYLLGFLLFGATLISILHAWQNLKNIAVRVDAVRPGFVGDDLLVPVELTNHSGKSAYGIRLRFFKMDSRDHLIPQLEPGGNWRGNLVLPATRRGPLTLPRVALSSSFPMGFFEAHRHIDSHQQTLIYPEPAGQPTLPVGTSGFAGNEAARSTEYGDDFAGMRSYQPGESQRRVDWKAVARGAPMLVKEFGGTRTDDLHLSLENAGPGGLEERLSQLTLWALRAESQSMRYSLQLAGDRVGTGLGENHLHAVLKKLALYPAETKR